MNILPQNPDGSQGNENSENEENSQTQSQNNNGNIGREVDDEKESTINKNKIDSGMANAPNEIGNAENQEGHWAGNNGQKSPENSTLDHLDTRKHPKSGYNHIENVGGTSQEDIDKASNSNEISDTEDDDEYGL